MHKLNHLLSSLPIQLPSGRKLNFRYPHERTQLQLARRVRSKTLGRFTLGLYQSFPSETPDYVTTQVCRYHSPDEDDFECLAWTVTPVTPERLANWPEKFGRGSSGYMLALSDTAGNIVLFDFLDQAEAEQALHDVIGAEEEPGH